MSRKFSFSARPQITAGACLAFAVTADHVSFFLEQKDRYGSIDAFVALGPDAAWALQKMDMPYLRLEDGFSPVDMCDLAPEALVQHETWANWVDNYLQNSVPDFKTMKFQPAKTDFYWLKLIFDTILYHEYSFETSIRSWKPCKIFYVGRAALEVEDRGTSNFHKSIYATVLKEVAARQEIEIVFLPEIAPVLNETLTGRISKGNFLNFSFLKSLLVRSYNYFKMNIKTPKTGGYIFPNLYDWWFVLNLDFPRNIKFDLWPAVLNYFKSHMDLSVQKRMHSQLQSVWEDLVLRPEFRSLLGSVGNNFWGLVVNELKDWLMEIVPSQWAIYEAAIEYYKNDCPRAVGFSVQAGSEMAAILAAFQYLKVPIFAYQHGGYVGSNEIIMWDYVDSTIANYVLTYGAGVSAYLSEDRSHFSWKKASYISVGSARLDRIVQEIRPLKFHEKGRSKILLLPSAIINYAYHFDGDTMPCVLESELQLAMVSVAKEYPEYDFIYRPFPGQQNTPAMQVAKQINSNCTIETSASLSDLFAEASLIVLTFPSTPLLEVLSTNSRVLVMVESNTIRIFPQAKSALERRATVAQSKNEFLSAYRSILDNGQLGRLKYLDDEFLRLYGTFLNDGKSAQRALSTIINTSMNTLSN